MTRGELNRLGDRLVASDTPSDADLNDLAVALATYQRMLEQAKADLRSLGFTPTGRVKTTRTMTDKLRRTHGMELSRMQDLAGARIVVDDLKAQDEAKEKIGEFYTARESPWREVDRRKDPRFGYKAVHLVVRIDAMPVEIQIRTKLQDTWAQIFERLADRWGRGIRYGEDPEHPDSVVRSGEFVSSRRDAVAAMMTLSDVITGVEETRALLQEKKRSVADLADMIATAKSDPRFSEAPAQQRLASKIPSRMLPIRESLAKVLSQYHERLDSEGQALLEAGSDITGAQLTRMLEIANELQADQLSVLAANLGHHELELQDILQLIASATDEGA